MQSNDNQITTPQQDSTIINPAVIREVFDNLEELLEGELQTRFIGRHCTINVSKVLDQDAYGKDFVRLHLDYAPEGIIASKLLADHFRDAAKLVRDSVGKQGVGVRGRLPFDKVEAQYLDPKFVAGIITGLLRGVIVQSGDCSYPFDMNKIIRHESEG